MTKSIYISDDLAAIRSQTREYVEKEIVPRASRMGDRRRSTARSSTTWRNSDSLGSACPRSTAVSVSVRLPQWCSPKS